MQLQLDSDSEHRNFILQLHWDNRVECGMWMKHKIGRMIIRNIDIEFLDLALFNNFIDFQDNDLDNI